MNADGIKTIAVAVGLGLVGFVVWRATSAGGRALDAVGGALYSGAQAVGTAVNPANPDNLVNRGVTAVGSAVSGDPEWTLGGAIYEAVNGDANAGTGGWWDKATSWGAGLWSTDPPKATYDETDRLLKRYPAPGEGGATGSW